MVEEIRNSEFDDVLNSKLAVVDFSAVWCGPCQMLAPILEELSDEMDGEADFYSADVDENRDLAYQFDIQSIPAIVIFSNGEEVERTVGFMPKDELKAFIKSAVMNKQKNRANQYDLLGFLLLLCFFLSACEN